MLSCLTGWSLSGLQCSALPVSGCSAKQPFFWSYDLLRPNPAPWFVHPSFPAARTAGGHPANRLCLLQRFTLRARFWFVGLFGHMMWVLDGRTCSMRAAWGQAKGEGQLVGPTIELLRPTLGPFEPATTGGFPERGWFPHLGGGGSGRAGVPSVCVLATRGHRRCVHAAAVGHKGPRPWPAP